MKPVAQITTDYPLDHRRVRDITYSEPNKFGAQSITISSSWGIQPAGATVTYVGNPTGVTVGSRVRIEVGGHTYEGICKSDMPVVSSGGQTRTMQFVDYREEFDWDDVFGCFNKLETLEVGGKRIKRYYSILPGDFMSNIRTYHPLDGVSPLTAAEILTFALSATRTPWRIFHCDPTTGAKTGGFHPSLANLPAYDIDAMNGKKLGAAIEEVISQHGIVLTILPTGPFDQNGNDLGTPFDLVFARKGEGALPSFPAASDDRRDGLALSNTPTRVTVVGGRNTYQILNVDLEPDWSRGWEAFYDLRVLEDYVFENFATQSEIQGVPPGVRFNAIVGDTENVIGRQLASARAMEITVGQFATHRQVAHGDGALFTDWRKFSGKPRMWMPAALYIKTILFRAFRVRQNFKIVNNAGKVVPVSAMELVPQMLAAVTHDPVTGRMAYDTNQASDGPGYAIVQGYMVGADGFKTLRPDRFNLQEWVNLQDVWQHIPFQIDDSGESDSRYILFDEPVIRSQNFFTQGDTPAEVEEFAGYSGINANATFDIPPVKASLTFAAERFAGEIGYGVRNETISIPNLNEEFIGAAAGNLFGTIAGDRISWTAIPFPDGKTATQKAVEIGTSMLSRQFVYKQGGYRRIVTRNQSGGFDAGTQLSGMIDRVTIYSSPQGLIEEVDFTSERTWRGFQPDRDFDRIQRDKALFPGQKQLQEQVNQSRLIAAALRSSPRLVRTMADTIHGEKGRSWLVGGTGPLPLGTPVWMREQTTSGGRRFNTIALPGGGDDYSIFAGTTIVHNSAAPGHVWISPSEGIVTVRVKGPVGKGQTVGKPAGGNGDYLVANPPEIKIGVALDPISSDDLQDSASDIRLIRIRAGAITGSNSAWRFRGEWNSETQYEAGDIVIHRTLDALEDGNKAGTYEALVPTIGEEPFEKVPGGPEQTVWATVAKGAWPTKLIIGGKPGSGDGSVKFDIEAMLGKDLYIGPVQVCEGNTIKSVLVLRSDAY